MTNYLIRHITDSTNHTFTEVIKPRENERYEIVSAKSKEEAEDIANKPKGLLNVVPSSFNDSRIVSFDRPSEETMESLFGKDYKKGQWPMRILKTLLIITLYELSKYVTNEIITRRQANDAVDKYPMDYEEDD